MIDGDPLRPVVISPSQNFQADWTFDLSPMQARRWSCAWIWSATPMPIRKDNKKVSTNSGKTLGDTGEGPLGARASLPSCAPQPRPEGGSGAASPQPFHVHFTGFMPQPGIT